MPFGVAIIPRIVPSQSFFGILAASNVSKTVFRAFQNVNPHSKALPPSPEANPSIGGFASQTNPPQAEKGSVIPFHHRAMSLYFKRSALKRIVFAEPLCIRSMLQMKLISLQDFLLDIIPELRRHGMRDVPVFILFDLARGHHDKNPLDPFDHFEPAHDKAIVKRDIDERA